jgi:ribosomal protein L25 (general stress protein Ctc)
MEEYCRTIRRLRERPGNVVKIVHDEDNEVVKIFIQSQEQRKLFKKFGEVVEIDGTYKVDKAGMPHCYRR